MSVLHPPPGSLQHQTHANLQTSPSYLSYLNTNPFNSGTTGLVAADTSPLPSAPGSKSSSPFPNAKPQTTTFSINTVERDVKHSLQNTYLAVSSDNANNSLLASNFELERALVRLKIWADESRVRIFEMERRWIEWVATGTLENMDHQLEDEDEEVEEEDVDMMYDGCDESTQSEKAAYEKETHEEENEVYIGEGGDGDVDMGALAAHLPTDISARRDANDEEKALVSWPSGAVGTTFELVLRGNVPGGLNESFAPKYGKGDGLTSKDR